MCELLINEFTSQLKKLGDNYRLDDLFLMAPPAFLRIELFFKDKTKIYSESYPITKLSTGERHFIYSFATVMYQLKNLDSVPRRDGRVYYDNICIFLEENDLYSHPEMQRIQVAQMIEYIKGIDLRNIKNINIGIVTHSPILLSDIPRQNVLFLNNGKTENIKDLNFAANIHSLYKHSFFMDLPMGEFAKNKILEISKKLEHLKDEQDNSLFLNEIMLIGEPISVTHFSISTRLN